MSRQHERDQRQRSASKSLDSLLFTFNYIGNLRQLPSQLAKLGKRSSHLYTHNPTQPLTSPLPSLPEPPPPPRLLASLPPLHNARYENHLRPSRLHFRR